MKRPWHLIGIALTLGILLGACSTTASPPDFSTPTDVASWMADHPDVKTWMESHPDEWAWMREHWNDVPWMQSHWQQLEWMQAHPGALDSPGAMMGSGVGMMGDPSDMVRWMSSHNEMWTWMREHWATVRYWMQDHWSEMAWMRSHLGVPQNRISPFWRRYFQMVAVMAVGMFVAGAIFLSTVGLKTWDEVTSQYPTQALMAMAAGMTLPMMAWMLFRRMGWRNANEMAATMVLPVIPFLCLVWFGVTDSAQCGAYCVVTLVAMYGLMRYRRAEYALH